MRSLGGWWSAYRCHDSASSAHPTVAVLLYLIALGFGVAVHYSIMLSLAAVSFWIIRAQGLVYGYFNFLQYRALSGRRFFHELFRFIFGWIIPVVIVANIPARLLIKSLGQPGLLDVSPGRRGHCRFGCPAFSGALPFGITPAPARKIARSEGSQKTYASIFRVRQISACALRRNVLN